MFKVENQQKIIDEISLQCREDLPEYAQPIEFKFISQLPRTAMGKVDYRKLEQSTV